MDIMNVEEYKTWIGGIARRFKQSQIKAATAVNVEMLKFYFLYFFTWDPPRLANAVRNCGRIVA